MAKITVTLGETWEMASRAQNQRKVELSDAEEVNMSKVIDEAIQDKSVDELTEEITILEEKVRALKSIKADKGLLKAQDRFEQDLKKSMVMVFGEDANVRVHVDRKLGENTIHVRAWVNEDKVVSRTVTLAAAE
ncbi:hypothetical protein BPS13_0209 [Bacillus phage BPS13]|uniref:Uncharacterized protein n=2 Tax=Wphvirus TaxID=1922327 RepID=W5QUW8_9CAUD|nr:hypothetical protein BPS13_0209 [Bacillus phage BPS13]YP_009003096.1 hypothetical protein BPS10C_210 [Bacillus phage BPS10C]AEZ50388.1 hypothetical protein BPS13_0209 [Bacillus phage BPS13]AGI12207.1 hypothetical protein BPS10C_210 [Bacillus phage BPS10C]